MMNPTTTTTAEPQTEERIIKAVSRLWLGSGKTSHIVIPKKLAKKYGLDESCLVQFEELEQIQIGRKIYKKRGLIISKLEQQ
jgi:hypothetical protein